MYDFLRNDKFIQQVQRGNCFFFGKQQMPSITWDHIIEEVDRAIKIDMYSIPGRNKGHQYKFGLILRRAQTINHVQGLMDAFSHIRPDLQVSAHCYISFTTVAELNGRHRSKSDVLFWQAIGSTTWTVDSLDGVQTYRLDPGCLIYCPSLMYHDVKPLTPRVGISLGLDHFYKKEGYKQEGLAESA